MIALSLGLLIDALTALTVVLAHARPQQPVTDPVLDARRRLAKRVEDECAREEYLRERADDLNDQ